MYTNICVIFLQLVLATTLSSSLAFYIRTPDKATTKDAASSDNRNDEWGVFQNTLGLSQDKVELLKSQKDQQATKELLNRFIMENPKYLSAPITNHIKRPRNQYRQLLGVLANNLKGSKRMLKTSFNFELADRSLKPLKRTRRKIAVKMVSDMPSERIDHLLKMFYQQHNMQSEDYESDIDNDNDNDNDSDNYNYNYNYNMDQHNDNDDYSDADLPMAAQRQPEKNSDYVYDNMYDDEGDVGLSAASNKNSEFGSFQDLILQAKRNQWEHENEETKLHNLHNDHFI